MAVCLFILLQERIFADALAIRLEQEPDLEVVVALDTRSLPPRLIAGSPVDVVLLDADIPDDAAFRMCEELSEDSDVPRVIFLSHSADPERIARGIRAGAVGWVGEYESLDRLLQVIRGAATGAMWLPPGETAAVLRLLKRGPDPERNGAAELLAAPTGREPQISAHLPSAGLTVIPTRPKRLITSAMRAATRWPFGSPRRLPGG
jgi:DNA-binding NarL/FixJ family response regulator